MNAASLSAEEQQALVQRMIASRPFARAPQVKDFLLFIVQRTQQDGGVSINETEIGRHVLRRQQSDFDPNTDNIVRVQARHLRQKVDEYFGGEGRDEPVLLSIPKGSYVPKFVSRDSPAAVGAHEAAGGNRRRYGLWLALGGAAALALGWLWIAARPGAPPAAKTLPAPQEDLLWAAFARTRQKTSIVLSDSSVSVMQNVLRKPVTLSQYLSPGYPKEVLAESGEPTAQILGEVTRHPYTSLNSAIVASRLLLAGKRFGVETMLRFPRDITVREFKSENFLLIGSKRSVPWMELVEDQLNFVALGNPQSLNFYISNKAPKAGEQREYRPGPAGDASPTYASIALLPNVSGTGLILCLQGLSGMANEAAEELISNPKKSPLRELLRSQPAGGLPRVEILIRATGMSGAPANVQVVATRAERR